MSEVLNQHFLRLRQETVSKLGRADVVQWITENTTISGRPFSFKNHEYQQKIVEDTSQEIVIKKCSQVGISELSLRFAASLMILQPRGFSIGYVFPTATFSAQYSRTRFDPIIQGSPTLRSSIADGGMDNAEVKQFFGDRTIYFKGAQTGTSAISTSLDMVIFDELSFCDQNIIGDYQSRLTHSPFRWKVKLSTPTFPGDPIDKAFQASRRHWNFCRCNHCGHRFIPDYFEHVVIPGYRGDLKDIKRDNLHKIRYQDAHLRCPHCGAIPSLQPEHREWVVENPGEQHLAAGFQIQPFDAPNVISIPYLVEASTSYASLSSFIQFSLGKSAESAESGLTPEDIDNASYASGSSSFHTHVMGIDLGTICHFTVGGMDPKGAVHIVHAERCQVGDFRSTYAKLTARFRVSLTVSDTQPYVETILQMQETDPNLYGAFYVKKQGLDLYEVKVRDPDSEHALSALKQVSVNRNAVLDKVMNEFREGGIKLMRGADYEVMKAHLTDMKRAAATLQNGEFASNWVKSAGGQDHYHHSTLYCWVAAQLRGLAQGQLGGLSLGVTSFKMRAAGR